MVIKQIKLDKKKKQLTIKIKLEDNKLTNIQNVTFKSVKYQFDEDILLDTVMLLDDVCITDDDQFESSLIDVKVYCKIIWNIDEKSISEFEIDDIDYNTHANQDRRTTQYLIDNLKDLFGNKLLVDIDIQQL